MTTDPSAAVVERLEDEAMRLHGRGIDRGCVDSSLAGNLALEAIALIEARDATIERLSAELERAFREGWAKGYRAGVIDGGSDSSWCDEEGDWQNSETRAALSNTAENG